MTTQDPARQILILWNCPNWMMEYSIPIIGLRSLSKVVVFILTKKRSDFLYWDTAFANFSHVLVIILTFWCSKTSWKNKTVYNFVNISQSTLDYARWLFQYVFVLDIADESSPSIQTFLHIITIFQKSVVLHPPAKSFHDWWRWISHSLKISSRNFWLSCEIT